MNLVRIENVDEEEAKKELFSAYSHAERWN
jgi:hypothetical protein